MDDSFKQAGDRYLIEADRFLTDAQRAEQAHLADLLYLGMAKIAYHLPNWEEDDAVAFVLSTALLTAQRCEFLSHRQPKTEPIDWPLSDEQTN